MNKFLAIFVCLLVFQAVSITIHHDDAPAATAAPVVPTATAATAAKNTTSTPAAKNTTSTPAAKNETSAPHKQQAAGKRKEVANGKTHKKHHGGSSPNEAKEKFFNKWTSGGQKGKKVSKPKKGGQRSKRNYKQYIPYYYY